MILNKDIDVVTAEFDEAYKATKLETHDYLLDNDMPFRRCMANERVLKPNTIYLAAVPSVNILGGLHQVIIETDDQNWAWVYDPNKGREGRKHVAFFANDYEVPVDMVRLIAYIPEYEFTLGSVQRRYKKV